MSARSSRPAPVPAEINGQSIQVEAGESLLQAALRQGFDFPYSCRVGGCGTCKCRLVEGKVKELTETGYLLTAEELAAGKILACQSVPRGKVRIEVDLSRPAVRQILRGRVVGQKKCTADITCLEVKLADALPYKAGQYAELSLASLPGLRRNYSFATPSMPDGLLTFFVRKVPGGAFSSRVNDQDLVGEEIEVQGPLGDFFLRPGTAPILMVAGGSGLAPLLAMLQEAEGVERPVTLLFGARQEADLYALAEIQVIADRWKAPFVFVPVLSEPAADSHWTGERGLVTEKIVAFLQDGAHAYLCGPPAMVDRAESLLRERGILRSHIHADRFLAGPPHLQATKEAEPTPAGIADYLKFFLFHAIGLLSVLAILGGGAGVTVGLIAVVVAYVAGDAFLGEDLSTPHYRRPGILTAQLWMALPLLSLIVFSALWSVSAVDVFGFGAWLQGISGFDILAAREATAGVHHISTWILTGLMIGMVGTITAHELTHRTWDPISMAIGRWLLAFSFDTIFAIEHVYGHHRYVSTAEDPATAPRGRSVYAHIVASTVRGNISAWKIECLRLQRKGLAKYSWHNAVIRGHGMSLLLVAAAWAMGGAWTSAFFVACALWGKSLLEIVNYMEHYGIVRDPRTPVHPRHSWNTTKKVSSWAMFNLTRHSHHHAQGEVPYHELKPLPDAPVMINGYLTTILLAMVPPLWHHLMTPRVLAWDRDYASADERRLAEVANARSGIPALSAKVLRP